MQPPPPNPEAEQPSCGSPADQICDKQNVEEHKHSSQDSVKSKRKESKNLLILRGALIEGRIFVNCPICDQLHIHEWSGGIEPEIVKAGCKNITFVKYYQIGPFQKWPKGSPPTDKEQAVAKILQDDLAINHLFSQYAIHKKVGPSLRTRTKGFIELADLSDAIWDEGIRQLEVAKNRRPKRNAMKGGNGHAS